MSNALSYNDGPLIWVDCEMTGLNVETDRIIEIAVIITDGRLNPVDEGIEYVIQTPKEVLDQMDEWCTNQHGKSGLTESCINSPHTYEEVTNKVVEYIQKWVPEKGAGLLAGSSVHADMRFLYKGMPDVMKHLSYRILDVSSVKVHLSHALFQASADANRKSAGGGTPRSGRWNRQLAKAKARIGTLQNPRSSARLMIYSALDDIRASIRELQYYREKIFIPVEAKEAASDEKTSDRVRKTAL